MKSQTNEVANTFKFRTVVFIILALIVPLWFVSLPLFLYFAYRSYVSGVEPSSLSSNDKVINDYSNPPRDAGSMAKEIETLYELLSKGALTQEEFYIQKRKLLAANS